jgi:hypothetical protein
MGTGVERVLDYLACQASTGLVDALDHGKLDDVVSVCQVCTKLKYYSTLHRLNAAC